MKVANEVDICSAYELLDWSGPNWPQPKAVMGLPPWDWTKLEKAYSKHIEGR